MFGKVLFSPVKDELKIDKPRCVTFPIAEIVFVSISNLNTLVHSIPSYKFTCDLQYSTWQNFRTAPYFIMHYKIIQIVRAL